jgi:hypothetical protein
MDETDCRQGIDPDILDLFHSGLFHFLGAFLRFFCGIQPESGTVLSEIEPSVL